MTARVPEYPPLLVPDASTPDSDANTIRNGHPVRARHWSKMADAINWMNGSGRTLVAGDYGGNESATPSSPWTKIYQLVGSNPLADPPGRVWCICLMSTAAPMRFTITFQISGEVFHGTLEEADTPKMFRFDETVAGAVPSPFVIGYSVAWTDTGYIYHVTTTCTEIPLGVLQANDGPDQATIQSGHPIYADSSNAVSHYGGVVLWHGNGRKRRSIFSWCFEDRLTTTDASFDGTSNVFYVDPALQARHLDSANTSRTVDWAAFCVGTGGAGEIRLTTAAGSDTQTIPAGINWVTGTIDIETDDVSRYDTDGGIRGGSRDTVAVELRVTTAGSVSIASLTIGDA